MANAGCGFRRRLVPETVMTVPAGQYLLDAQCHRQHTAVGRVTKSTPPPAGPLPLPVDHQRLVGLQYLLASSPTARYRPTGPSRLTSITIIMRCGAYLRVSPGADVSYSVAQPTQKPPRLTLQLKSGRDGGGIDCRQQAMPYSRSLFP